MNILKLLKKIRHISAFPEGINLIMNSEIYKDISEYLNLKTFKDEEILKEATWIFINLSFSPIEENINLLIHCSNLLNHIVNLFDYSNEVVVSEVYYFKIIYIFSKY